MSRHPPAGTAVSFIGILYSERGLRFVERQFMSTEEDKRNRRVHLEWRDYMAIVIASLETTLLPIIIPIVVLILVVLALRH